MKILITGAAGFLGFNLAMELRKKIDVEIHLLDDENSIAKNGLHEYRWITLKSMEGAILHKNDLSKYDDCVNIVKNIKPEIVIHLAGKSGARCSLSQITDYTNRNIVAFANLLDALKRQPPSIFVYASSSSVYGNSPNTESNLNLRPMNYYALTKYAMEQIAEFYVDDYPTLGLRFFNMYGIYGREDMAYFKIAKCLYSNSEFEIYSNLDNRRDFNYVDDVIANMLKLVLGNRYTNFNSYYNFPRVLNFGSGNSISLKDLINISQEITGRQLSLIETNKAVEEPQDTFSDSTLLKATIGDFPTTSPEDGLKKFYQWFETFYYPKFGQIQ